MFSSLLVANRGEIACRIIRTAQAMGVRTVAVHSEPDASSRHVAMADEAVLIGPGPAAESYLQVDAVLDAARSTGAQAIHPGYGFLAESAAFARAVRGSQITWVGPDPETIEAMGDKRAARDRMSSAGVPVNAGGPAADEDEAASRAGAAGYPVIVKAAAGGGGIGMRVVESEEELRKAFGSTRDQAQRFFGDGSILIERYLPHARHVEIQVLGLADGRAVTLGERECSVQRRYQKVIEETPSPAVDADLRERMEVAVRRGAEAIGYRNAGTFECLVSGNDFVFLEVNTRLQVEHPVTELVTGIDLVAEQLRVAAGEEPGFDPASVRHEGHAIEMRVYAEDPVRFLPRPGTIEAWEEPSGEGVRVDAGYRKGDAVTPFYDPLLAKLCVWGLDRPTAIERAKQALEGFEIGGIITNLPFLAEVLDNDEFRDGTYDTSLVSRMRS